MDISVKKFSKVFGNGLEDAIWDCYLWVLFRLVYMEGQEGFVDRRVDMVSGHSSSANHSEIFARPSPLPAFSMHFSLSLHGTDVFFNWLLIGISIDVFHD